jgi:hypothetical protein
MSYKYEYDHTGFGIFTPFRDMYLLLHEGLKQLKSQVDIWNATVIGSGAKAPYEQESGDLERLIEYGNTKLAEQGGGVLRFGQISKSTIRYYRAGMELIVYRKKKELAKSRGDGWPSGAIDSLTKSIEHDEQIAARFDVPPADILWEVLPADDSRQIAEQVRKDCEKPLWDAFISHASEDKDEFVQPLAEKLEAAGLRVWYAPSSLKVGDSLRRSIDKGLSEARFGIVILSPSFLAKEWPQRELDGLVAREVDGQRVILPVWRNVSLKDVRRYSPTLADRVAARSEDGLESVVQNLMKVLMPA